MSKLRNGDRVKLGDGYEYTVCGYCPISNQYLTTHASSGGEVHSRWYDKGKLETAELLPKLEKKEYKLELTEEEYARVKEILK